MEGDAAPVENPTWEAARKLMMQDEEERVDAQVALARVQQRDFDRCTKEYKQSGAEEKMLECTQILGQYVNLISAAYCPLQRQELAKCVTEHGHESDLCDSMRDSHNSCLRTYAAAGNHPLLAQLLESVANLQCALRRRFTSMGHAPGAKEAASKPAASPSGRGPPLYHWRDVVAARTLALKRSASTGCTGARRSASADRPKATEARTANLAPVSSERKTPVPNVSRPKGFSSRKSETGREKEKDRELNIAVRTRPTGSFGYSTRSFDYQKRRGVDSPGVGSYAASPDTLNAKKDHRQGGPEPLGASHGEEQLTDACVYKGAMVFSRQRPTGTAGPGTYEWSRSDFDLLGAKRSHNVKYQRQVRAGATAGRTDARVVRRVPPSHGMPPSFTSLVQGDRDGREASPTSSGPHLPASTRSKSAPSPLRLSTAIPETVKELSLHSARGTREGSPSNSAEPSTTLSLFATRAHSRSSLRKTPRKRRGHGFGFSQLEATLPPLGSPHEGEGERQAREGVARFLEDLNLSAYVQVLFEEGYDDLRSLVTLTESDCVRLGLLKGHRARLLQAVAQLPAQDAGYSTGIRSHSVSPAQSASLSPRREVQVIELHASTEDMS